MATSQPSSQAEVQCPEISSSGPCLEVEVDDEISGRMSVGELMATSQPSSQSEVQCPKISSSGSYLEVDDEIPGPSAPRVECSSPCVCCGQRWNREWSSDSEEDLEEDTPGIFDLIPWGDPSCSPHYDEQQRAWEWSSNSQEEQAEELPGGDDPVLVVDLSSPPQSPPQKRKKELCTYSEEEQEDKLPGSAESVLEEDLSFPPQSNEEKRDRESLPDFEEQQPGLADLAPAAEPSLPPQSRAQRRKRESSSESEEELEQEAPDLGPEPQHPSWTVDTQHGLKMKNKRRRVSSVLPEHHEVFTRLLEDPVIKRFLAWDKELRVSDKHLLAMVIAYFSRAGLISWQYQRIHFFLALYIASDMEDDNQARKEAIFSFLYGESHAQRPLFHRLRSQFVKSMNGNLQVSREECEEIQAYDPGLWVWSRDRTLLPASPGTKEA